MKTSATTTQTFQFHFVLIYILAAFISLGIIISSLVLFNQLTSRYHRYATATEPMKYQLQAFNIDVNKQEALYQTYLLTSEEGAQKEANQLLHKKLPSRIELMEQYAAQLEDAGLKVKIEELEEKLHKLQEISKEFAHSSASGSSEVILAFHKGVQGSSSLLKEVNSYLYEKHSDGFSRTIGNLESGQYWILSFFLLLMGAFYWVVRKTRRFILNHIKQLEAQISEIGKGNIPRELPVPANELNTIVESVNYLLQNLRNVKDFSLQVGKGDFDTNISVFDNQGELGTALAGMRQSLKEVSAEDKQRNWVNQGLAQFHSLIRQHNQDLQELCYAVLSQLIQYVNANQGGVFIVQEDEQQKLLQLEASYAYNRKKYQEKVLQPGQGLAGQAYLEKAPIYLKEIPTDYVKITSGLGEAPPTTLLIQPLIVNEQVVGVMELAAFHDIPLYVQQFIEKVAESLGSAVATARTNERNNHILHESQQLTEQLRAQEEELRQNTEELQATQEEMERLIQELQTENQELKEAATKNSY
jgi:hypothetical protein